MFLFKLNQKNDLFWWRETIPKILPNIEEPKINKFHKHGMNFEIFFYEKRNN